MSSSLDGLDVGERERRDPYEPGISGFDRKLAEQIAAGFYDSLSFPVPRHKYMKVFEESREELTALLEDEVDEGFHTNMFLDSVLWEVQERMLADSSKDSISNLHQLLDPLVQALFDLGQNDFIVDVYLLPRYPVSLASRLRGDDERNLRASYIGDTMTFGSNVERCELELEGNAFYAGNKASDCLFRLGAGVQKVGGYSTGSTYYLASLLPLPTAETSTSDYPDDCDFYVEQEVTLGRLDMLQRTYFFERGNRLFHPSGGSWEKVTPE